MQKKLFDIGWSDESSAKRVIKRKAQKNTGSTIAQNGTRSDVRSQRRSEGWSKKREPQGMERTKRYCNASTQ